VSAIASIFGKSKNKARVFVRKEFNRENFERYALRSAIVHIATHFINNIPYPLYSALLFSSSGKDRPFYYAYEVFRLKLNAELVVLSACESSESHLLGLQGLRGMTAAFMSSGAQSMMVSMWPVDERNSAVVPLFYTEYLEGGQRNVSNALRAAKLSLMKQSVVLWDGLKISYGHPFIWDNYILYRFSALRDTKKED
jgi:CHAT domain-containing protein